MLHIPLGAGQMLTGTALAIVPLLVVFIIFGKQIIGGIMEGSVKS